jgi:hypothetical protein
MVNNPKGGIPKIWEETLFAFIIIIFFKNTFCFLLLLLGIDIDIDIDICGNPVATLQPVPPRRKTWSEVPFRMRHFLNARRNDNLTN